MAVELKFTGHRPNPFDWNKEYCYLCGREVKNPKHWIHVGWGGLYAITEAENLGHEAGDLGMQVIGPDCLRRNPELKSYL